MKKSVLTYFLLLSTVIAQCTCYCKTVESTIVPRKDREELSLFFEALIRLEGCGYTIFGDKPVSEGGCWIKETTEASAFNKEKVYKRGQELWEKYSQRLHIKDFAIKFERHEDWYGIFVVNKKSFNKVVNQNLDEFRKILGDKLTSETLLQSLLNTENSFQTVLRGDEFLIGTIFGYGPKNAQMYKRKSELLKDLQAHFTPPRALPEKSDFLSDFCVKEQRKAIASDSIQERLSEYYLLKSRLKPTSTDSSIIDLFADVGFLADMDTEETKNLLITYNKTKEEIMKAFLSENLLEAVLCKMAEG